MSDVKIEVGDLETLSSETAATASKIGEKNVLDALAEAPAAMPGSASAEHGIKDTSEAVDKRRNTLKVKYQDFSDDVMKASNSYGRTEAEVEASLRSAGIPGNSNGMHNNICYQEISNRMEGK